MIIEKIQNLLKEQNKEQKDLCEYLNLSKSTFSSWKSGVTNSYLKHLPKIAEFLGVSVDFLLGNEKSPAGAELSEKYQRLITAYDRSEPVVQATVDRLLGIEEKTYTIKVAARNGGGIVEKTLTEEEYQKLKSLPDVEDI